ncbi:hypothetical protein MUGA111182_04695 [Mucilaginibacter galii]
MVLLFGYSKNNGIVQVIALPIKYCGGRLVKLWQVRRHYIQFIIISLFSIEG